MEEVVHLLCCICKYISGGLLKMEGSCHCTSSFPSVHSSTSTKLSKESGKSNFGSQSDSLLANDTGRAVWISFYPFYKHRCSLVSRVICVVLIRWVGREMVCGDIRGLELEVDLLSD